MFPQKRVSRWKALTYPIATGGNPGKGGLAAAEVMHSLMTLMVNTPIKI